VVDVELLVITDCPHQDGAQALLRTALANVGLAHLAFETTTLISDDAARERLFAGSPTFLVNGADLFPGRHPAGGLACRLYSTASGMRGLPDLRDLRQALKQAAHQAALASGGRL
jgi:hypothetical protein